jgi:hypothetical protein
MPRSLHKLLLVASCSASFGVIAIMSVLSDVMALPAIVIYGLLIATSIVRGLTDAILTARGK